MLQFNGFYVATNQYMVVDTPVFDEIVDRIQIFQFYPGENEEGLVIIAEFGELDPHPTEINVKELQETIHSHIRRLSEEEKDEFCYKMVDSETFPKWLNVLESDTFQNNKEPEKYPRIIMGMYRINEEDISIQLKNDGNEFGYLNADGRFSNEKLSLVFHYGNKDFISVFNFVTF